MDNASLQRLVETHRVYSRAIQDHLRRLWARELSPSEVCAVQSYTVCGSFMSLESIDRGLSLAMSSERADEDFAFMQSEANKHSNSVIREVQRRLALGPEAPEPAAFSSLLQWEEALLQVAQPNGL